MTQQLSIAYKFNLDAVNLIIGALSKLPYEQVADLLNDIRSQAIEQLKIAEAAQSVQDGLGQGEPVPAEVPIV